ncbi:methyltransferase [Robertkochia marina]|uniref:Methyltransferase n=1 Tax=Robertkochia marina TaxID=1227945 RepID=A0A4S3M4H2_9FLAO|nr:methyltransferase [Robertkochia marina]THD69211.1 methyltransferase [Robertkochia marina]TRZ47530.1 methyltransferase [Robertkochia marina]
MNNQPTPHQQLVQMISGYAINQALYTAAKLDLAELIASHQNMSVEDLAAKAGAQPKALYRLLRALASVGVFRENEEGQFLMTPMAECLRYAHPQSVKAMALGIGKVMYPAFQELLYSVKTGKGGFEVHHGMPVFEYFNVHQDEAKIFDRMMTDIHGGETRPMIDTYDFSGFKTIVDVGGGNGEVLYQLFRKHAHLKGILFDLPHVVKRSAENMKSWGMKDRADCVGGNFFNEVPADGDAYILRHILHDWNDEDAVKILSNCCKAMNPKGKVLVVEAVIPPGNDPHPFKWLDLTMLLIGGKERTKEEFEELFDRSCLKLERVVPVTPEVSVVEAVRK